MDPKILYIHGVSNCFLWWLDHVNLPHLFREEEEEVALKVMTENLRPPRFIFEAQIQSQPAQ